MIMKRAMFLMGCLFFVSCGSSGLEFNGDGSTTSTVQPRTDAIPHFPLPIELFDPVEQKWSFFVDVDGDGDFFDDLVFQNGRELGTQIMETGFLPADAPNFAIPVTPAVPLDYTVFAGRASTDIWVFDGDNTDNDGDMVPDESQFWTATGGSAAQHRSIAVSFLSQWCLLMVDGCPRLEGGVEPTNETTNPIGDGICTNNGNFPGERLVYEDLEFQSLQISFASISGGGAPPVWNVPTTIVHPYDNTSQNPTDFPSGQQNKIEQRVVHVDNKGTFSDEILTTNEQAKRWGVAAVAPTSTGTQPTLNSINCELPVAAPPNLVFGAWRENQGENLFIESNYAPGGIGDDVPGPNYFFAQGVGNITLGMYTPAIVPGSATLTQYLFGTDTEQLVKASYYMGMVAAHIVGLGIGLPESNFVAPGVSNGEEDLMSSTIETDQVFFISAGRRMQFTSSALLVAQNVVDYPLDSQARIDAINIGAGDPLAPGSIYLEETLPGPGR